MYFAKSLLKSLESCQDLCIRAQVAR